LRCAFPPYTACDYRRYRSDRLSILSVQQHACGRRNINAWRRDDPAHDRPMGDDIADNQDTVLSA
jgi:hypothetical protein